jgi:hypothetical protein
LGWFEKNCHKDRTIAEVSVSPPGKFQVEIHYSQLLKTRRGLLGRLQRVRPFGRWLRHAKTDGFGCEGDTEKLINGDGGTGGNRGRPDDDPSFQSR